MPEKTKASHAKIPFQPALRGRKVAHSAKERFFASLCSLASLRGALHFFKGSKPWLIFTAARRLLPTGITLSPALAAGGRSAAPDTLDRVVASVGRAAITQSDVETEYRLEVFLEEGRLPASPPDVTTLEQVRDRLVNQYLMMREAELEGVDDPGEASSDRAEEQLTALRQKLASEEAFQSALRSLGMNEQQLLKRFRDQDRTLRLIDERLRPQATVDASQIEAYYREKFLPEYAQRGEGSPPRLAEVENQIREILVQQQIDRLLPAWLEKLRSAHRVRIMQGLSDCCQ